jgi:hypothetical protein
VRRAAPDFDESASTKLLANAHASLQHAHRGPNTLLLCLSPQKTQEPASRQDTLLPAADGGLKGQVPHQRWCPLMQSCGLAVHIARNTKVVIGRDEPCLLLHPVARGERKGRPKGRPFLSRLSP